MMVNASQHEAHQKAPAPALWLLLLIAAATLLAYNGDTDGPLDLYHEGERLAHYDALRGGELPFRDIYVPHGLGEDIIKPLMACRLFGESVESLRRLGQNSYVYRGWLPPLGMAATILAGAVLLRRRTPVALLALMLLTCLYEISDRQILGFLAVAALAGFLQSRRRAWLFGAGVFIGLAGLYSLEVGLYVAVAAGVWIALDAGCRGASGESRCRQVCAAGLAMIGGLAAVLLPFLAWCVWHGIVGDMLRNVHMQLFLRGELYPSFYPGLDWRAAEPLFSNLRVAGGTALVFYVIPALYACGLMVGLLCRRLGARIRSSLMLTGLLGATFWATVLGRPDLWHLAYATGAFFLFAATWFAAVPRLTASTSLRVALLAAPVLALLSLADFGEFGAVGRRVTGRESRMLPAHLRSDDKHLVSVPSIPRLGGVRVDVDQAVYLDAIVSHLRSHTSPTDTILDLSDQGLLLFLCGRRSPTRFHFISYCGTPALRQALLADILNGPAPPRYVLRYASDGRSSDALGRFVAEHYILEARIGYTELLRHTAAATTGRRPRPPRDSRRTHEGP
jgi:hypothetical protein